MLEYINLYFDPFFDQWICKSGEITGSGETAQEATKDFNNKLKELKEKSE